MGLLDRIIELFRRSSRRQVEELTGQLNKALADNQELRATVAKLQSPLPVTPVESANQAKEIERLKMELAKAQQAQTPDSMLSRYFAGKCQAAKEKRPVGRPKIDHKAVNFRLDLDMAIILEQVCRQTGKPLTRVLNTYVRQGLTADYPELLGQLSEPLSPEVGGSDLLGSDGHV